MVYMITRHICKRQIINPVWFTITFLVYTKEYLFSEAADGHDRNGLQLGKKAGFPFTIRSGRILVRVFFDESPNIILVVFLDQHCVKQV